ncbi:DUF6913 domain-containing protein [Lutibacter citreus]|uniref:DUF6913 domain-containing protein n=1 Tax=Lutibacter citreus TaxID=2138210 RepID=UPI000DBE8ED6|nr:hypothetical protein [Lutibacter citreus]
MIFTGIKRKSNQLFFNKKAKEFVENNVNENSGKIKNVIVLLDDINENETLVKELKKELNLNEKGLKVVVIHQQNNKNKEDEIGFYPQDFGWYGKIKSEELKNILTKKYDLLINYSKIDNLYNNLVLLQSKSSFRVGFAHLDNRFYDLLIDCKSTKTSLFNKELKKYLTILNKL